MTRRSTRWLLAALLAGAAAGEAQADASLHFGPPFLITGGFARPFGVGVDDAHGRLLVADTGNRRFRWAPIADLAGSYTFTEHGFVAAADAAEALVGPESIAADAQGNVYVVNTFRNEVQQYLWNGGAYQFNAAFCADNAQSVDGTPIEMPRDVAVGADGKVYLLDSGNDRILVADGPGATAWSVFASDDSWKNPYGLGVDADGAVYVADTGNHRIVKLEGGDGSAFGAFGTDLGQFRFPRDVAVDQHGRIFVADTYNHRIQVFGADRHALISIGQPPAVGTVDKLAIDASDRVFAVDSDNNHVIAFLGGATVPPFDPYFRDFVGDDGSEPSNPGFLLSSPDILVRHQADVDLSQAAQDGLESFAFQQPRYEEDNYVYVALRNRGTQQAADNFVRVYYYDPGGPATFPAHWKSEGFYTAYASPASNDPGNTLHAPLVEAGGVVVLGPLLWRPPAPDSTVAQDGQLRLAVRVSNPYDEPPTGSSTTMARDSNSVAERRVLVLRGPFTTGEQNTLVLRTHYPDVAAATDEIDVTARANQAAAWIDEVSYGTAPVNVFVRGPVTLPHPRSHYGSGGNTVLVEMVQDALDELLAADPAALDGGGPGAGIGRVILVTNDFGNQRDWATTGAWPYAHGTDTRFLTASVQAADNPAPLFGHGLAHQLNLVDLYAHEGVSFPKPYADRWDNMAQPFENAHPLVWSKELAYWVTGRDAKIFYVPRPPAGSTWNNGGQAIRLHVQESAAAGEVVGVAFGLTNGVTSFNEETAFYYVEARAKDPASADAVIPQSGVLMYYANVLIPQGQGPVIVRDHVPGGTLDDAVVPVGGSEAPAGTGISVLVQDGSGGADYDLAVQYNPPATDYDVYMNPGDPPWQSPDIWVDNQQDGYDEDDNRAPQDRGNQGIAGEENRVYARVSNHGPAIAFDPEVMFAFSEPYHTVGDEAEFVEFKSVFLDQVKENEPRTPFVTWTPQTGVEPHTCARVELRRLFDDTNASNNIAQRNLQIDHSVHGSPYTPVEFRFTVTNPDTAAKPVYFRAEGVPAGWSASFAPAKLLLAPGARGEGLLKLVPPDDAPDCTTHKLYVTAWLPRGDTLIRLGGTTVSVGLQRKTAIKGSVRADKCTREDLADLRKQGRRQVRECARVVASGCTQPPLPNQEIVLRYEGPDGEPIYHTVTTDANGCYEDSNVVVEGGPWTADAIFGGDACQGPASDSGGILVPLPQSEPRDPPELDPEQRVCVLPVAARAKGVLEPLRPEGAKGARCRDEITSGATRMVLELDGDADTGLPPEAAAGRLELAPLRLIVDASAGGEALVRGRFRWRGAAGFAAIGTATGTLLTAADGKREWRLELLGTVVDGAAVGARLRAVATLRSGAPGGGQPLELEGSVQGVLENACALSDAAIKQRIALARQADARPPERPCRDGLPCLQRLQRRGSGELRLDQTAAERCTRPDCSTRKTWEALRVKFDAGDDAARRRARLMAGELIVPQLATAFRDAKSVAEQGGRAMLRFEDGSVAEGRFGAIATVAASKTAGSASVPVHADEAWRSAQRRESGPPLLRAVRMEGQFHGRFTQGALRGARLELSIALQAPPGERRRRKVEARIDGWLVQGCIGTVPRRPGPDPVPPRDEPAPVATRPVPRLGELDPRIYRTLDELPPDLVAAARRAAGAAWNEREQRTLRLADRKFRDTDRDRSGALEAVEFDALFPSLESSREQLSRALFPRLDADRDGALDAREAGARWETLRTLDRNRDARLSRAELAASVVDAAAKTRARIDRDRDGRIDATEFALWWRTLPAPVFPPAAND